MKLKKLIQGLPVECRGSKEIEISGLCSDSRRAAPSNLFIAKKGTTFDGSEFIDQAIDSGCSALLCPFYNPFIKLTQIIHPRPQEIEAELAARFYREPSRELFLFGVTGTNGKTTTTYLVKHLLDAIGVPCGLMGTVETILGRKRSFSTLTTHDAVENQKVLREMCDEGCKAAALEISSHGLEQGRVREIQLDAALFTNLTEDHLDYHQTIEAYARSKKKLFELLDASEKPKRIAIANADDPWTPYLFDGCKSPRILFGLGDQADLRVESIVLSPSGTKFSVRYKEQIEIFFTPLLGRFNVYNLLGAVVVGLHLGLELGEIASHFKKVRSAPGRLQRMESCSGKQVIIDYAHTADALKNTLETLRELAKGKIITVFGAGGGRDPGRRSGLARAAEALSDLCIITSDNPRNEDPNEICRQILAAFQKPERAQVEVDRKKAIEAAIDQAKPGDLVLVAGKGHEKVQIFSNQTLPFDDSEVVREYFDKVDG